MRTPLKLLFMTMPPAVYDVGFNGFVFIDVNLLMLKLSRNLEN